MKNKLAGAVGWNIATKIVVVGISFLSIPIFTHLLTTNEYGNYAYYMSWVGILLPLVSCGLHLSIARARIEYNVGYSGYVSSVISLMSLIFIIEFIIAILLVKDLEIIFDLESGFVLLLLCHAYFNAIILIVIEYFRYENKYKTASFFEIMQSILIICSGVLFVSYGLTGNGYIGRVFGTIISMSVIASILLFMIFKSGKIFYSKKYWEYGISFSLPLVPGAIALVMNTQIDKILITKFLTVEETGIYSFTYTIGMLVMLGGNAIKQAINPWIFNFLKNGDVNSISLLNYSFAKFVMLSSIISLYVSPELIDVIAPEAYHSGTDILIWIILGGFFQQLLSIEVTNVMFLKKTKLYSIIMGVGILSNITMNLIFIPKLGILGAAITTACSFFLMFILLFLINKITFGLSSLKIKWYINVIGVMFFLLFLFELMKNNFYLRYVVLITFLLIFTICHREKIIKFIDVLKRKVQVK